VGLQAVAVADAHARQTYQLTQLKLMANIVVSGATGNHADMINGIYLKWGAIVNDKPVFVDRSDVHTKKCVWYGADGYWHFSDWETMHRLKDVCRGNIGVASSAAGALVHPALTTRSSW
jgi:hypothetical protein